MGIFDAFKFWRGGQADPTASTAPRPASAAAAHTGAQPPGSDVRRDTSAEPALPAAATAPSDHIPLIHDDADPEALARALDTVPEPAAEEDTYLGPERRRRPRMGARPGTRILIVDDSVTIVAVLRKMLQQNGYVTFEAYTAEKALELIEREPPELVFLDIVLPGMDGFNALRAMRRHPVTKTVPIIMISGNAQATEQFYVQRIGADDFMKKPFTRAEVFARIERLLDEESVPRRIGHQVAVEAVPIVQG